MTPEEIAKLQAENDRLKAENDSYKAEAKQAKKAEIAEFLDNLIGQGRLAPIAKDKAERLLNYASDYDSGDTLDFNEGEDLTQQVKDFLATQPVFMIFSEIATKENAFTADLNDYTEYAENVPREKIELDQKIRRYAKQHNISYREAFLTIQQGAK